MIDPGPNRTGPDPLLAGDLARAHESELRGLPRVRRGRWPSASRAARVVGLVLVVLVVLGWVLTLALR